MSFYRPIQSLNYIPHPTYLQVPNEHKTYEIHRGSVNNGGMEYVNTHSESIGNVQIHERYTRIDILMENFDTRQYHQSTIELQHLPDERDERQVAYSL